MRSILLVVRHEIASMLGKRSFWVMTFLFPLLIVGLNVGTQVISRRALEQESGRTVGAPAIGYVDEAGLIATLPSDVPGQVLRSFPDRASAQAALDAGQLSAYYVVPRDYISTGELIVVQQTFTPFGNAGDDRLFEYIIVSNLTGDENLATLVMNPLSGLKEHALAPQGGIDRHSPLAFGVPYAVMFVFFFSLTMSGSLMLQSVAKEKENRTAEVLLLSLRPRELMMGKMVGLGLVALFQMIVWASGGWLVLGRGTQLLGMASFALPAGFVVWVLLYFVLGFLMYASALGAIGAVAPTAREGAQFTFIVLLPLMAPLWLNSVFTTEPNGGLATFLSLFPLTAPVSMLVRLVSAPVPAWQPVAGLVGLALTAYLFVLLAARLFRADTLLSTASLTWKRLWRELRG
jgi:ABC-2 type transport system permease protein